MTTLLRDGTTVEDPRLGRLTPVNWTHVDRYPLSLSTIPSEPKPMVGGFNWYDGCDRPTRRRIRGRDYWVIEGSSLKRLRGGHAVPFFAWGEFPDLKSWWLYYNQGTEGRCVEFAWLRERTLNNRVRYDITSRWHYFEMQRRDYWQGGAYPGASPQYEGTSVDAGAQVMHQFGPIVAPRGGVAVPLDGAELLARPEHGISTYRWATGWDDVRATTGVPDWMPGVPMGNNWGPGYPQRVILLDDAGARLHREDGEFCVVTDR